MADRALFKGVVNIIIKQGDKTLLFFRNDGFFNYGGGCWVLPAGHIEQEETPQNAAIREAKEELGIDIAQNDIKCVHVMSNIASRVHGFEFFFEVSKYTGTIRNCEPDKCVEMKYFTFDEIKGLKNAVSTVRIGLPAIANKQFYSECLKYSGDAKTR